MTLDKFEEASEVVKKVILRTKLMYSDYLSTVSPTNAKELLKGDYAYGLESVLKYRKDDFFGILNGIDYVENNPSGDNLIDANYTFTTFNKKSQLFG